jgi:hypothetical protein
VGYRSKCSKTQVTSGKRVGVVEVTSTTRSRTSVIGMPWSHCRNRSTWERIPYWSATTCTLRRASIRLRSAASIVEVLVTIWWSSTAISNRSR